MTLQQQAIQAVEVLPEEKLPFLIQFARFLQSTPNPSTVISESEHTSVRRFGRLKGKIQMAEDFNDTPDEFKEYI